MRCKDCPYYWQDIEKGDTYPHCQWSPKCPDDFPPCEEPEQYEDGGY